MTDRPDQQPGQMPVQGTPPAQAGSGPPPQAGYGVPPPPGYGPPPQAGYGVPPPAGYGPPPQAGYGAPPPAGYGTPQPGYGPPQPGYGPPSQAAYGRPTGRRAITPLALVAGGLLVIHGLIVAGFTGLVFLTGSPAGLEPDGFTGPVVPDNSTAALIVMFFFVGVVEIAVGTFAALGREWARWMGVTLAVVFGLIWLLLVVAGGALTGGGVIPLLLLAVNAYIAVALIAAWRWRTSP